MARKKELETKDELKKEKKVTKTGKKTTSKKSEVTKEKKVTPKKVVKEEKNTPKTKKIAKVEEGIAEKVEVKKEVVIEEPKKKSLFGIVLTISCILLIVLAFIVSIIETNEKNKYYIPISYDDVAELLNDDEINIIYWASPTCNFCSQFKPIILDVSSEYGIEFNYLNTSKLTDDEYATMYTYFIEYDGIYSEENLGTPSLILVKDGKITNISVGALTESELITYLQENGLIQE